MRRKRVTIGRNDQEKNQEHNQDHITQVKKAIENIEMKRKYYEKIMGV